MLRISKKFQEIQQIQQITEDNNKKAESILKSNGEPLKQMRCPTCSKLIIVKENELFICICGWFKEK